MASFIGGKMNPYTTTITFLLTFLSGLQPITAHIDGCGTMTNRKLTCKDYHSTTFPYDADYEYLAELTIKGSFNQMDISPKYEILRKIIFRSANLTELHFKPYAGLVKLRAVDVRENNIERVDFTDVQNLTIMNQILLSFNKIKTFDGCEHLKEASSLNTISFHNNELEEIDFNCFPKNLAKLFLHNNNIKNLSSCQPLKDLTSLRYLIVGDNKLEAIDFSCIPFSLMILSLYRNNISDIQNCQSLKSLPNLARLSLSKNNLESFDFSCLPYTLNEVYLLGNKISRVEPCSSLQALTQLTELFLSNNHFDSFDFSCLSKGIINLSLANNSISDISSCDALKNLPNLQHLYLNGNNFTSFNFSCLPMQLSDLDLANNTISQIFSSSSLSKLPGLTRLSLAQNAITSVDFRHLPQNVRYLYLHNNFLSHLDLGLLTRFTEVDISVYDNPVVCSCLLLVQYVKAVRNPNVKFQCSNESECLTCNDFLQSYPWTDDLDTLRRYDDDSMGCFASYLKEASSSLSNSTKGCVLEKVHDLLPRVVCNDYEQNRFPFHEDFKDAESLDVRGDFSSFEIDSQYAQIRHIKLMSLKLTSIDINIFNEFNMLKILDVSSSGIESVIPSAHLTKLDEINLNSNNLSTASFVRNQSFSAFTNLKRLYLKDNKLEALKMKHLPRQLVQLEVGNNIISDIVLDGIETMHSLKFVDLSFNKLESFPLNRIPGSVEKLLLKENKIFNINMDSCSSFKALKLDVRNNQLNCSCDFITGLETCNIELECNFHSTCFTCRNSTWLGENNTSFQTVQHLKDHTTIKCGQVKGGSNAVKITTRIPVFIVATLVFLFFLVAIVSANVTQKKRCNAKRRV